MMADQRRRCRPTILATINLLVFVKKLQACVKSKSKPNHGESRSRRTRLEQVGLKQVLKKVVFEGRSKYASKNGLQSGIQDPQELIDQIDGCTRTSQGRLSDVAANDRLLLRAAPVQSLSTNPKQLTSEIQEARCCLARLQGYVVNTPDEPRDCLEEKAPSCQFSKDVKYLANVEHLLLRHLEALLSQLTANIWLYVTIAIDLLQRCFGDEYYTEYQDGRRRQSTTWPWCIKSSLAILWGVCWKFEINHNQQRAQDRALASGCLVGSIDYNTYQTRGIEYCSLANAGTPFGGSDNTSGYDTSNHFYGVDTYSPINSSIHDSHIPVQCRGPSTSNDSFLGGPDFIAQPGAIPFSDVSSTGVESPSVLNFQEDSIYSAPHPNIMTPEPSSYHVYNPDLPGIRIEDESYLNTQVSQASQAYQAQQSPGLYNTQYRPSSPLSFHSINSLSPYSPSSPNSANENTWAGSMTPAAVITERDRYLTPSASSTTSMTYAEDNLAVEDDMDPPVSGDGRLYCRVCPQDKTPSFKRPCEWKKHMDRHQRPYHCKETRCSKLPGFTYSGGLARHEREVHSKGVGADKLYCPHETCKRSKLASEIKDRYFTRRENLAEHIRRLHTASLPADASSSDLIAKKRKRRNSSSVASDSNSETDEINSSKETKRIRREYEDLRNETTIIAGKLKQMEALMDQKFRVLMS